MRALLILTALMAWVWCVVGAIVLTGYLAGVAVRALRGRPGDGERHRRALPPGLVPGLVAYAVVMAACGAGLAAVTLKGGSGDLHTAARWGALPWWSAATASATAVVLQRRINGRGASAALDPGR